MKPKLNRNMSVKDFDDYYFLKEDLVAFCRDEGLKVSGSKSELEDRIRCYLGTGEKLNNGKTAVRRSHVNFSLTDVIGDDFVCSQEARKFFSEHLGTGFRFRVSFQRWLKDNPDKTFADAMVAYQDICLELKDNPAVIGKQFKYNRYVRDFFRNNPDKNLDDAIRCWKYKKSVRGSCVYEDSDLEVLK